MLVRETQIREVKDRTAVFQVSDETIDRHGTIIKADGWDFTHYEKNPIVLYGHNTSHPDYVIGKGSVYQDGTKTYMKMTFVEEGLSDVADKTYKHVESGTIKMASVGFTPISYEWQKKDERDVFVFTKAELNEVSIVPVGSNKNALKKSAEDIELLKEGSREVGLNWKSLQRAKNYLITKK